MCEYAQVCLTLCDPKDCSLPNSLVHGISQARILKWLAISFSRGSSQPRDRTGFSCVSCTGRWILYGWATWEAHTGNWVVMSITRETDGPRFLGSLWMESWPSKSGKQNSVTSCLLCGSTGASRQSRSTVPRFNVVGPEFFRIYACNPMR